MSMKFASLLCLLYVVVVANGELEKPKAKKESPKYKIIGGSSEYEIRKYAPATFAYLAVSKINFEGAIYVGAKPILKYFDGDNVEGVKLNETTPIFIDFIPTVGKEGEFNATTKDYNVTYLIPSEAADNPPTPLPAPVGFNNITVVKAPKFYSYVKKFAGYAFEKAVLKHATALHEALVADDVDMEVDYSSWCFAQYDGAFLESRNEVAWVTTSKPDKKLWTIEYEEDQPTASQTA